MELQRLRDAKNMSPSSVPLSNVELGNQLTRRHNMRVNSRPWNKETLFARLEEICTPEGVQAARKLYSFAEERGATFEPWNDGIFASATARFRGGNGKGRLSVFALEDWLEDGKSKGKFAINFAYLARNGRVPQPLLVRLAESFRTIPGVKERLAGLEERQFRIRPSLPIDEILVQPGAAEKIQAALDDLIHSIPQ